MLHYLPRLSLPQFLFMEPADQVYMDSPGNAGVTYKPRMPASPTKRVETQRTVTPDGTVITTVTTTTAKPKQISDRKAAMNSEYRRERERECLLFVI